MCDGSARARAGLQLTLTPPPGDHTWKPRGIIFNILYNAATHSVRCQGHVGHEGEQRGGGGAGDEAEAGTLHSAQEYYCRPLHTLADSEETAVNTRYLCCVSVPVEGLAHMRGDAGAAGVEEDLVAGAGLEAAELEAGGGRGEGALQHGALPRPPHRHHALRGAPALRGLPPTEPRTEWSYIRHSFLKSLESRL